MQVDLEEAPVLDVESYAANYNAHARTARLRYIADKAAGTPLELEALKLAAEGLKQTEDTETYLKVMESAKGRLGPGLTTDREWVDQVERRSAQRLDRLESELNGYKTNLIKESIRMGHNDLGDFYYGRGDLQNAFKCYVRTRDYCTTPKHILTMCLNVIKVAVEMGNYVHVNNYVQKAEQTPEVQEDAVAVAKLKCASGLAALNSSKYKQAALRFTEASAELGSQWSEVLAPQDVATYGALCSLASLTRPELRAKVIDNVQFREFLELTPDMREVVADFYASKYAGCLAALGRLRAALQLDLHLGRHLGPLLAAIRERALLQYTAPFSSVDLATMATAFNTSIAGLQKELEVLIGSGQVHARIDSHGKVLYARRTDQRNSTFQWALKTGEDYVRESKGLLLRASLLQHDLVQRSSAPHARGPGRPNLPDRF